MAFNSQTKLSRKFSLMSKSHFKTNHNRDRKRRGKGERGKRKEENGERKGKRKTKRGKGKENEERKKTTKIEEGLGIKSECYARIMKSKGK